MISTLMAIPLTCWLCALIALPRRPLPGNEVAELVYARLLGRHQRLLLVALAVTVAVAFALLVALTQQAGVARLSTDTVCTPSPAGLPACFRAVPGGWQEEQMSEDGTWRITGPLVSHPSVPGSPAEIDPAPTTRKR